ncbi:7-cyano-7-deazaguanine synthase [Pseudomonadota bacterium]
MRQQSANKRKTTKKQPVLSPLEDSHVTSCVQEILINKRGYVAKIPKSGTNVIAHLSGGLDSAVVCAMLAKVHKLNIYPVYFDRNLRHSNKTLHSAQQMHKTLKNRYPSRIQNLQILSINIPPLEISDILTKGEDDIIDKKTNQHRGVPFQQAIYAYNCVLYAMSLNERQNVKIRTIFSSVLTTNTEWYAYETTTARLVTMLDLCVSSRDWNWQFLSYPMHQNLDKAALINWGREHKLPLHKTWTCAHKMLFQCGVCNTCGVRRQAYSESDYSDNTIYLDSTNPGVKQYVNIFLRILKNYTKHQLS